MRIHSLLLLAILSCVVAVQAVSSPVMPVYQILEECYQTDDLAVVVPDRLELIAESTQSGPWCNCFAGFETKWRGPIEIEVQGSGGYGVNDIFSIAALSLDYGGKNGWIERSFFGLGLIQNRRDPHPPTWGVGSSGKFIMRGNFLNAKPEPQRLTIDPAKYAPKGWNGRLWIGLVLHNPGVAKTLKVRILNAIPPSGKLGTEPDQQTKWNLLRDHQRTYLERCIKKTEEDAAKFKPVTIVPEMQPYMQTVTAPVTDKIVVEKISKGLSEMGDKPLNSQRFRELTSAYYSWRDSRKNNKENKLNEFISAWRKSGQFGQEIGCVIRTASNLEKVGLTDIESGRILGITPAPIKVSAARHEYEGFQIVFSPISNRVKKVTVSVTDLKGNGGRIASSNVTINPVGYTRIFVGEPGEALVADPLLIGSVPDLNPGENQPVWVTVRVPDDAKSGEYRGNVVVSAQGIKPLRIPIALKVRNFNIPKKISLRSSFWMFRDQINRFYHLDEVKFDDYMKWIDFALEHRLCPIDVYEGQCKQLLEIYAPGPDGKHSSLPNKNPDFTEWDHYIDHMLAGGANTIHLGQSHHQGAFFADKENPISSSTQVERVIEDMKILREHYKARGVFDLHYMQLRDETSAPDSLNVYREVQKQLPDVKLLLTAPSGDAKPFLSIPCPLTPGFDAAWRDEIKAKGGEYWWYVCCAPQGRWANFFINQTAAENRALFWQTWSNDVEGLLYWGLNFWVWYEAKWPADAKGPSDRIPPIGTHNYCPVPATPGDGFSIYPGPTPSQPLSSIRLEIMRDGEEDYEYFLLLDRLIADAETRGNKGSAVREAKAAREAARKLVSSMTDYEKTGSPYLAVRERIGDAIERLLPKN